MKAVKRLPRKPQIFFNVFASQKRLGAEQLRSLELQLLRSDFIMERF